MTQIKISEIYIYPVKSLAGIKLNHWTVAKTGFLYDRKWMLIDQNMNFLSQRKLPQMALIQTALSDQYLILNAPGMETLTIPLTQQSEYTVNTNIWQDQCAASVVSQQADQWFSHFLKTDCRLVYQPDNSIRKVDPSYATASDQTAFSDGFPFLIISDASLTVLNQAMQLDLEMVRFRPNLVITGCDSYAEDSWREIEITGINFRLPKPCSRCSIPNIDPLTAQPGNEPIKTLSRLRKWNNQVYFGQNALHDKTGQISVGDEVTVIQIGEKQPPL